MVALAESTASPRLALVAVPNSAVRALCCEALHAAGFTVADSIESGAAVIANARERHPDVVILSEQLSDVPASEAIKWLRSNQTSAAPLIIVLGNLNQEGPEDQTIVLPRRITQPQLRDVLARLAHPTISLLH